MNEKDNYLQSAELSIEQNANMIDGILGNNIALPLAPSVPVPEVKPLDKVIKPRPFKRNIASSAHLWALLAVTACQSSYYF